MACRSSPASPPTQCCGAWLPMSPRMAARDTMPSRNASGNVASESSGTPRARRPFQVNATVTQRSAESMEACTSAADCTSSVSAASQARPPAGVSKVRNS